MARACFWVPASSRRYMLPRGRYPLKVPPLRIGIRRASRKGAASHSRGRAHSWSRLVTSALCILDTVHLHMVFTRLFISDSTSQPLPPRTSSASLSRALPLAVRPPTRALLPHTAPHPPRLVFNQRTGFPFGSWAPRPHHLVFTQRAGFLLGSWAAAPAAACYVAAPAATCWAARHRPRGDTLGCTSPPQRWHAGLHVTATAATRWAARHRTRGDRTHTQEYSLRACAAAAPYTLCPPPEMMPTSPPGRSRGSIYLMHAPHPTRPAPPPRAVAGS